MVIKDFKMNCIAFDGYILLDVLNSSFEDSYYSQHMRRLARVHSGEFSRWKIHHKVLCDHGRMYRATVIWHLPLYM
jgi:hypothetical protein